MLPFIHLAQGDIPPRVLVCGDPARAERISKRLTEARCLAQNREYWTYTGLYQGVPVAVVSHGVGSGGAAIAFESLWRAGARVIIRVGTCGGMQPEVTAGSIVVATAACREEGVTEKMVPLSYPAVADGEVVTALMNASRQRALPVHKGIILTQALFFPELLELTEDHGGNTVIRAHPERFLPVEVAQEELTDVDTPQALRELEEEQHN